jgi:acetylornithine deacetylase
VISPGDLEDALALLARLVAVDTRNPPRAFDAGLDGGLDGRGVFAILAHALGPGFQLRVTELGEGCASLLAVRGAPKLLFNVHVDTVPADADWPRDPFALHHDQATHRLVGLGACDIKGAAACLVTAAARTEGDVALLFTSDEEAGSSRCVRGFLAEKHDFSRVVVAEPTQNRAVLEHRGIATCSGTFHGTAGHASARRALGDSALHEAIRWSSRAIAFAEDQEKESYGSLTGVRFNLGILHGGTKANMIASTAELRYGVRPRPDQKPIALLDAINGLAPRQDRVAWTAGFVAPPLPAPGADLESARTLAASLGLPLGEPVDFWTEAALFSEAGLDTIVYGPGDIAQAHAAGEYVELGELATALAAYTRILAGR